MIWPTDSTYTIIAMGIAIASMIVSMYLLWILHTFRDEVRMLRDNNRFYIERYDNILDNWRKCVKLVEDVSSDSKELLAMNRRLLKLNDIHDE